MDTNLSMGTEQPMSAAPQGLKPVKSLLREAWLMYKAKFWMLLGMLAIPYLAAVILMALAAAGFAAAVTAPMAVKLVASVLIAMIIVTFIYIQVWGQASLITFVAESGSSIKDAYLKSKATVTALFTTNILVFLMVLFGLVLFVVPGIYFALLFMFTSFIVVLENVNGFAAAMKSREYFRGIGFKIFGRLLALLLVYIVYSIAAGILSGIVSAGNENVQGILRAILNFAATPFWVVFMFMLYSDVKRLKGDVAYSDSKAFKIFAVIGAFIALAGLALFVYITLHNGWAI